MFKKINFLLLLLITVFAQQAWAQMTDAQIMQYVAEGLAAGKSERQIGDELLSKGVSSSQLQRMLRMQQQRGNGATAASVTASERRASASGINQNHATRKPVTAQAEGKERPAVEISAKERQSGLYDNEGRKRIYGRNIFQTKGISFEPNQNLATPEDYVLGPGDELIVDIWGANEVTIRQTISPEGTITVTQVGPIALSGLTIREARGKLKSALSKTYSTLQGGGSKLSLTLGEVRTILVNVLGEVEAPGTYRLSSFATVFNALYNAGGVTEIGSLRRVCVRRGGKDYASVDIYSFIFDGKMDSNISLKEGDVVYVPAYDALVGIEGFVKRPMFYELKTGESVDALIGYAGGFSNSAWTQEIQIERKDGQLNHMFTVKDVDFGRFPLQDGDIAYAQGSQVDLFANRVSVRGSVYRPGEFQLGGEIATVRQLVEHAGGLMPDAFQGRAQLVREKEDRSLEMLSVPIGAIMNGLVQDVLLRNNDILVISDINEIDPKGDFTITGMVQKPGSYPYAEHTTVEDLILLAGGLVQGASSAKVDIARRIDNPGSTSASDVLAEVFSVSIEEGLLDKGAAGFELMPNDIVSVRKSPTFIEQRNVTISGEVTFPGQYTLVNTNERVSQLVERAGGATPNGNVRGAMLKRRINPYEQNVRKELSRLATQTVSSKDSLDLDKIKVADVYAVGLELDKALQHPGSDYDLILRDGDELIIPEMATTVRIQGEVLYPNTVQFISGKPVSYYVEQAGGFTSRARRAKTYVVYMNGTVAVGSNARLEPGCEIVVPARVDRNKLTTGEWLGIGTSAASIATMVATIVNLLKK